MELSIPSVEQETKNLLGGVRRNLVQVMLNLNFLRSNEEHWGQFETFPSYCQQVFDLSPSMTSKLLKAHDAWILKEGYKPEELEGIDYEKLYGYVPLLEGKQHEVALAEVKTWSRNDIKTERGVKIGPHNPKWITFCEVCEKSQENHD